jgi:hypothetical protein
MDTKIRRYFNFAFLVIGLYLLVSLFVPGLILWTKGIVDLGGQALSVLEGLIWAFLIVLICTILFLLTRFVFLKEIALNAIQLTTNLMHSIGITAFSLIALILLSSWTGITLFPPLFPEDGGLAIISLFLGTFYVLSSVRDLNKMDEIHY